MFSSKILIAPFMNYFTAYKCVGFDNVNYLHYGAACFSKVFHYDNKNGKPYKNTYTIKVFKPILNKDIKDNNFCVLSKSDIIYFLKDVASYGYNSKPLIKLDEHKKYYIITMEVNDTPFAHKFLLTYVRYLYETPFNVMLYETIKVKKECEELKNESIFNLFHLILKSNKFTDYYNTSIHSINQNYIIGLYNNDYINKAFNNKNATSFDRVFKQVYNLKFKTIIYDDNKTNYIKYFALKKYRKTRIKTYIENYKLLKEL